MTIVKDLHTTRADGIVRQVEASVLAHCGSMPLGDDVTFLPGHGGASRIGTERLNNPFLQD